MRRRVAACRNPWRPSAQWSPPCRWCRSSSLWWFGCWSFAAAAEVEQVEGRRSSEMAAAICWRPPAAADKCDCCSRHCRWATDDVAGDDELVAGSIAVTAGGIGAVLLLLTVTAAAAADVQMRCCGCGSWSPTVCVCRIVVCVIMCSCVDDGRRSRLCNQREIINGGSRRGRRHLTVQLESHFASF